jgi:hypothetical protein
MATILYIVGLIIGIFIIGLTIAGLFQSKMSSLELAVQLSGLLLSGFVSVYCFFGLVSRIFTRVSQQPPRARQDLPQNAEPFTRQDVNQVHNKSLPQSRFAQELMRRNNLSYDEIRRQKELHGHQLADRLKTDRTDRQAKFERWPHQNSSGFYNISRNNHLKR